MEGIWDQYIENLTIRARDDIDDFIFEFVKPYCEIITQCRISKHTLEIALNDCMRIHPELFKEK